MSLRKLVVVLVVVCVCAVTATVLILQLVSEPHNPTGSAPKVAGNAAPAYAYITSEELVVMRGDQAVARVRRIFDAADPYQNKVVWTHSGNYIAMLSDTKIRQEDDSTIALLFVNAQTGSSGRISCPYCTDLTAVDMNSIVVSVIGSEEGNLIKYNLDFPTGPGVPLPFSLNRKLLASTQSYLLTSIGGFPQGGSDYREELTLSHTQGTGGKIVGSFDSNDYMLTAVANASQGGGRIAVAFNPNPGECVADSPISILATDGQIATTDMSAAQPPGYVHGVQGGVDVNDLWWGSDGQLRATIVSWTCDNTKRDEVEKKTLVRPSSVWKLDGQKWVNEDSSPATMVRQLDQGKRAVLVIPDCVGPVARPDIRVYCNTGALYREESGRRALIAEQVISISAPPM